MKERIAIITGAGSGIGRATAHRFAKKGIKLLINGRNESKLKDLEKDLNSLGLGTVCHSVIGSVTENDVMNQCVTACMHHWQKPPDVLVACAGRGLPGTLVTSDEKQWDDLINTNIKGLMVQLKAISGVMLKSIESGMDLVRHPQDIIVIGSTIGRNVSPFNSVYGATKFAAHGLTEALRRELSVKGIRVTLIEPGIVKTNFQNAAGYDREWFQKYELEVGPVLTADNVAEVIEFAIGLPGNVNLDDISIRPTRQPYP